MSIEEVHALRARIEEVLGEAPVSHCLVVLGALMTDGILATAHSEAEAIAQVDKAAGLMREMIRLHGDWGQRPWEV